MIFHIFLGPKQTISHYHETLGEALQGTELEFSGLEIEFRGESSDTESKISIIFLLEFSLFWTCKNFEPTKVTTFFFFRKCKENRILFRDLGRDQAQVIHVRS